jgi:alanyl-tRNA synthetase
MSPTKQRKPKAQPKLTADIRQAFLGYYSGLDHKVMVSSPVIPFDDPTLLFINAGMNQFKKVFTGEERAPYPRVTTVQKCLRAGGKHNDLENVGFTSRHHTFFEMLGNFSFGDYFKEEAIRSAWEFLTITLHLDPARLYVSVLAEDDEAFAIWEKIAPELRDGRIMRFGEEDNFWSMGDTGPCGPSSEIHYDRGERFGAVSDENAVNGSGERFVEIWNLVFMQYNRDNTGKLITLPKGSIDTGAGLERLACVLQDADSNYDTDIFSEIIKSIEEVTGAKYETGEAGASHRVVADHLRALCFCIADGGGISNEKQGYVLRRILRRAARHGRQLGSSDPFLYKLVPTLVTQMGGAYPELQEKQEHITKVIRAEEESFGRTLDAGLSLFQKEIEALKKDGASVIPGSAVFKLYDTHGFPVDLTEVMAVEQGMTIDQAGFEKEMEGQRERGRESSQSIGITFSAQMPIDIGQPSTLFVRDDKTESKVLSFSKHDDGVVVLIDRSPFLVESGGQISDTGTLSSNSFEIQVKKMFSQNDRLFHVGDFVRGSLSDIRKDETIIAEINTSRRRNIERNHTATHLLQAALRQILGEHVKQSGSLVNAEKLRFDFSHFEAMTEEQVSEVEQIVNREILKATPVVTTEMSLEEAKRTGAMQLFGEKYGDTVRVVSVGEFSKELCGGTHVTNTAEIGPFMITMEGGIASGVRRVEAITGDVALEKMLQDKALLSKTGRLLKTPVENLQSHIEKLLADNSQLQKEIKTLKAERFAGGSSVGESEQVGAVLFWRHDFGEIDRDEITGWADSFKSQLEPVVAVARGEMNGKVTLMFSASQSAVKLGLHIGNSARKLFETFGARGGGKENFAQGSAPEDVAFSAVISAYKKIIQETLSS